MAVIYDFDGTIGDTLSIHLEAYTEGLAKLGINASSEQVITHCFNKTDDMCATAFGIPNLASQVAEYHLEGVHTKLPYVKCHSNLILALKYLTNKSIPIGIATSATTEEIQAAEHALQLDKYFSATVTSSEVTHKKPHPETFLKVCNQLNVSPENTIIIGDHSNDIIAAHKIKSKSILYYPPEHERFYKLSELTVTKPDFIIRDHEESIPIFENFFK